MRTPLPWIALLLATAPAQDEPGGARDLADWPHQKPTVPVPKIDGEWWRIASNPDLGEFTTAHQQPVDFAIWQAADGSWQLWSCIRGTRCGGQTRLFHRWEGRSPEQRDWRPRGIAMQADPTLGETAGGLQAPHVFVHDGAWYMVYGDWERICLMRSDDGKTFTRVLNERGQPDLFAGPFANTRDAMVLPIGGLFHCYYTGLRRETAPHAAVFCRTSHDLARWSEPIVVSAGGDSAKVSPGACCECPFVVHAHDTYYLFRTVGYPDGGVGVQYASPNPLAFGVDDDRCAVGWLRMAAPEIFQYRRRWYVAALTPELDGIRVARLRWDAP
ncbi:MAG: hypothetical protein AB7O97_07945 [Planctomycetota bacterium]